MIIWDALRNCLQRLHRRVNRAGNTAQSRQGELARKNGLVIVAMLASDPKPTKVISPLLITLLTKHRSVRGLAARSGSLVDFAYKI
ncbi:hypothetical protein SESI111939_18425 [Serratia silvae]